MPQKLNCEVVFGFEINQDKSGVCSPVWKWWKHRFVLKKACFGCDPAHSDHWCPEELSGLMAP